MKKLGCNWFGVSMSVPIVTGVSLVSSVAWANEIQPISDPATVGGLMQALATLLTTGFLLALGFGVQYLVQRSGNSLLQGALTRLEDAIGVAVRDVHQTYVAAIKEANMDGKLTMDEQKEALRRALESVKELLGMKGLKIILRAFGIGSGGLDSFLTSRIESEVVRMKNEGVVS